MGFVTEKSCLYLVKHVLRWVATNDRFTTAISNSNQLISTEVSGSQKAGCNLTETGMKDYLDQFNPRRWLRIISGGWGASQSTEWYHFDSHGYLQPAVIRFTFTFNLRSFSLNMIIEQNDVDRNNDRNSNTCIDCCSSLLFKNLLYIYIYITGLPTDHVPWKAWRKRRTTREKQEKEIKTV